MITDDEDRARREGWGRGPAEVRIDGFDYHLVQGEAVVEVSRTYRDEGIVGALLDALPVRAKRAILERAWRAPRPAPEQRFALMVTFATSTGPGCQCAPGPTVARLLHLGHRGQWRAVHAAIQAGQGEVAEVVTI